MMYRVAVLFFAVSVFWGYPVLADEPSQSSRPDLSEAISASHNPSQLLQVANAAVARDQLDIAIQAMNRLVEIRPYHQGYALQLVALHAQANDLSNAFDRLYKLSEQGMAADLDAIPGLDSMRQYPLYAHIRDAMKEANDPVGKLSQVAQLDRDDFSASSVAMVGEHYIVGSIRTGEVISVSESGETRVLVDAEAGRQLGSVSAMVPTADGEHLWLAVNDLAQHLGHDPADVSPPTLVKINLDGEVLRRVSLPQAEQPGQLADIEVATDGTVYAVDQRHAAIYRAAIDAEQAELIGSAPRLTSLRAVTLVDDERKLIVADYSLGLIAMDLSTMQPSMLAASENLNLGGIESLAASGQVLMAVQSGFSPERILRLELDEAFNVVARGVVQAKAHPEFMYPMRGQIHAEQFIFVANSYLPLLGNAGEYAEGVERGSVSLMATPLEAAQAPKSSNEPPEMLRRR